jgi:hypothetical protein
VAPSTAPAAAEPNWRRKDASQVARWHDHRTHWMGSDAPPSGDQSTERVIVPLWTLPLTIGADHVDVTGEVVWVPPPPTAPFVALALGIAALVVVLTLVDERLGLLVLGGLTAVIAVVECIAVAGSPESSAGVQLIVFGPVALAAIGGGVWFLHHDNRHSGRLLIAAAAVVVGALAGLVKVSYLSASELPTSLPAGLARADVAMAIGVGLGALLLAAWWAGQAWSAGRRSDWRRVGAVGA